MALSVKSWRRRIVINGLRTCWLLITCWYEYGIFLYSAAKCGWPLMDVSFFFLTNQQDPKHVLLIADPQIIDKRSYPGRPALLTYISQLIVDLNLRKNWRAALRSAPDVVFFLGDYMDSGRAVMSDAEYERYVNRFMNIFSMDSKIPRYYIPGNHDVGLGPSVLFSPHARTRYTSHFGPLNSRVSVANHTFVLIDAPGLVEEDYKRHGLGKTYDKWNALPGKTVDFVKSFVDGVYSENSTGNTEPTILLSHIPLSRPEGSNCGPLRERGTIRRGVGLGYQNTLGKDSSTFLLEHLRPTLIFSGDDHDYCEVQIYGIREVTVKSLSMAMGIKKPGYQMLSLVPPGSSAISHTDAPCVLPDQLRIYLNVYIPLALISLAVVLIACIVRGQHYRRWSFRIMSHTKRKSRESTKPSAPRHFRTPTRTRIAMDEYGFTLDDSDTDQRLPPPASASVPTKNTFLPVFSPGRILLRGLILSQSLAIAIVSSGRRGGLFGDFLGDVRDVAMFPIGIIFLISFWTFLDI
ncbi:Metallo-dependent phosphatase-like protein [Lentinula aciculospora]|uniref:Metallo-dependent phosphatase-like protein n=1 Tax=Lentinula aciculospora TaxID=153920 RepID=A0A9W9AJR0_9AGAR|nr:Metallo-dependent phosphatase-like protein [Lentinula aciculospora]